MKALSEAGGARLEPWSVLAGARFALAFIVACGHMEQVIPIGLWSVVPRLGSFEAVMGFLLISGYSIATSYQAQPQGFLLRRAMRVYPVYLTAMLLASVAQYAETGQWPLYWVVLANLFFVNNVFDERSIAPGAWSMALEVWLYILTPWLFTCSLRTLRWLVAGSFLCFVIYTVMRTGLRLPYYAGTLYGSNLVFLSFVWLSGLLLARDRAHAGTLVRWLVLMFGLHIGLDAAIQFGWSLKHDRLTRFFDHDLVEHLLRAAVLLGTCLMFAQILRPTTDATRASPTLRFLGDISFPLYLSHAPVYALLKLAGLQSPTLFLVVAMAVSAAIYLLVDRYSQQRHWRPRMGTAGRLPSTPVRP